MCQDLYILHGMPAIEELESRQLPATGFVSPLIMSSPPDQTVQGSIAPGQDGQTGSNQSGSQSPVPGAPRDSTGFGANGAILIPTLVAIAGPASTTPGNGTANLLLPPPPPGLNTLVSQPLSQLGAGALSAVNVFPPDMRIRDPYSLRLVGGSVDDTDQPMNRNQDLNRRVPVAMAELEENDELEPDKPAVAASSARSVHESPTERQQAPAAPAEQTKPADADWFELLPQSEEDLQRWFEDMLLIPGMLNQPLPSDVLPEAEPAGVEQD